MAKTISELLFGNTYPGRGIMIGATPSGGVALAYFIMGRSENSRNRVFKKEGESVTIYPFDETKVKDPSLIIYSPVRVFGKSTVVTNGDQTDTVYDALACGETFESALQTRTFEPDAPNFTPRISGIIRLADGGFSYCLSIIKTEDGEHAERFFYDYEPKRGEGHIIHTYLHDGSPLPSFEGEPRACEIPEDIDVLTANIWHSLDADNRIALYVRYIDAKTGAFDDRLVNRY